VNRHRKTIAAALAVWSLSGIGVLPELMAQESAVLAHGDDLSGVWNNVAPEATRAYQGWAFSPEPPPMTAWAQARFDASRPTFGPRGVSATESNDPVYQCYPPGLPRVYFHPFPLEIIQLPGRVLMMFEYHHQNRQIPTDGRGHREELPALWLGDSIGRWEGKTLVVETVNFNDQTWLDRRGLPHSDQLKVTERIQRVGADRLQIDFRIEDPIAFPEPWTGQRFYERVDWQIEEFACMERNRSEDFSDFETQMLDYSQETPDVSSQEGDH
jgi:hypothetical protein